MTSPGLSGATLTGSSTPAAMRGTFSMGTIAADGPLVYGIRSGMKIVVVIVNRRSLPTVWPLSWSTSMRATPLSPVARSWARSWSIETPAWPGWANTGAAPAAAGSAAATWPRVSSFGASCAGCG